MKNELNMVMEYLKYLSYLKYHEYWLTGLATLSTNVVSKGIDILLSIKKKTSYGEKIS
jgi:hypothetical protein